MATQHRTYGPESPDQPPGAGVGTGTPADEKLVTEAHERDWRGDEDNPNDDHPTQLQLVPKPKGDEPKIN